MSLRTLEREIVEELRVVARNPKIRLKDLLEWSTGKIEPREGEVVLSLPKIGVSAALKRELVK